MKLTSLIKKSGMILPFLLAAKLVASDKKASAASKDGNDLLLVIDMQNAYASDGPWACPHMSQAAERIVALLESGNFGQIIFTRFDAPRNPVGTWKDYNRINQEVNESVYWNELIPQLKPYVKDYPLFSKSTYSSLTVPEIQKAVEECTARGGSLVLTGVVSECCVLATAFQAIDMGCPVIYLKDACAGINDRQEASVVNVLAGLDYVQTTILDTAAYLKKPF